MEECKKQLITNIRKHLWDSQRQKFIPHIYLNGSPFPETFDENQVYYHGGTAVAILAGLLTKEEIAHANQRMLENVEKAHAQTIALTMYPTYPTGSFPECRNASLRLSEWRRLDMVWCQNDLGTDRKWFYKGSL